MSGESFAVALLTLEGTIKCKPTDNIESTLEEAGLLFFIANIQVNNSVWKVGF